MSRYIDWPEGMKCRLKTIVSGETDVSSDPGVVISTVLGSCVSVCIFDPQAGIGGANHYFLSTERGHSASYGAVAMELLINGLMRMGAERGRMRAKLFGGALMKSGLGDIGKDNATFALSYLQTERFPIMAMDLGGFSARRLHFHPVTGKARVVLTDQMPTEGTSAAARNRNDLELFYKGFQWLRR